MIDMNKKLASQALSSHWSWPILQPKFNSMQQSVKPPAHTSNAGKGTLIQCTHSSTLANTLSYAQLDVVPLHATRPQLFLHSSTQDHTQWQCTQCTKSSSAVYSRKQSEGCWVSCRASHNKLLQMKSNTAVWQTYIHPWSVCALNAKLQGEENLFGNQLPVMESEKC